MLCLPNRMGPTQRRFINLHQSELENRGRLQRQQRLLEQYCTRPKCLELRRLPERWRLCWADIMVPHWTTTGMVEDCHNRERNGQFGTSLCPMPVPASLSRLPEQFVCYTFGVSQCVTTLSSVFTGLFAHDKINMCTLRQWIQPWQIDFNCLCSVDPVRVVCAVEHDANAFISIVRCWTTSQIFAFHHQTHCIVARSNDRHCARSDGTMAQFVGNCLDDHV